MAENPLETLAAIAVAVAVARLASREKDRAAAMNTTPQKRTPIVPLAFLTFVFAIMLAGCGLFPPPVVKVAPDPATFGRAYSDNMVAAGEQIAQERCASCHPVKKHTVKNTPPALGELLDHRTPDQLTDSLVAAVPLDHYGMPRFDFNIIAANALVAYLETLGD